MMTTKFINPLLLVFCFIWIGSAFSKTHDKNRYYVMEFYSYNDLRLLRVTLIAEKDLDVRDVENSDLKNIAQAKYNGKTYSLLEAIARYQYYSQSPHYIPYKERDKYQKKADDYILGELLYNEKKERQKESRQKKSSNVIKQAFMFLRSFV